MSDRFQQVYQRFHWSSWQYPAGNLGSLKGSAPPIPSRYGVYLIRAPKALPRVRGSSNVVYIGQSGGGSRRGKQGIGPGKGGPGRLFNTRGPDERIRERIEDLLFRGTTFSVECVFLDTETDDPKDVEDELLSAYREDHCELPPANHSSRTPAQAPARG